MRRRILSGDFVVLRILPIVSVLPSPFAFFSVTGLSVRDWPTNGGLLWPKGFQLDEQPAQRAIGSKLRDYPFARSTAANAAAIAAGRHTPIRSCCAHRQKLFFVPGENGTIISPGDAERPAVGAMETATEIRRPPYFPKVS
jgi:hypothetical protein